MWFILVNRLSLFGSGSDQAMIFWSDWASFSQQLVSAMVWVISMHLCNTANFRDVSGKVYEPSQFKAVTFLAVSKYDHLAGLILLYAYSSFHEEYNIQTKFLICGKELHKVIYYGKIQNNSPPPTFFFFFIIIISTISNYRHEIQVISGLRFLLRKWCL